MYIVKWYKITPSIRPYFRETGGDSWVDNIDQATLFFSEEEAIEAVKKKDHWWWDHKRCVVEFIHPLNVRSSS